MNFMHRYFFLLIAFSLTTPAIADDGSKSCARNSCAVGETVTTYATKSEQYYACPTKELADYTTFILGTIAAQYELTGTLPNISQKTGEPEYLDDSRGPNMTRRIIERFRNQAHVATFDQAVAQCSPGRGKTRVMVMNVPAESTSVWVVESKTKKSYWMPRSNLDRK